MAQGFLAGLIWGGLAGVGMLAVSTQVVERREIGVDTVALDDRPEAAEIEVPAGTEFDQARQATEPEVPAEETRPGGEAISGVTPPSDMVETPPAFDTAALEMPDTTVVPDGLGEVPAPAEEVDVEVTGPGETVRPQAPEVGLQTPQNGAEAPTTQTTASGTAAPEAGEPPQVEAALDPVTETDGRAPALAAAEPETTTDGMEAPGAPRTADAPGGLRAPDAAEAPGVGGYTAGDEPQATETPSLNAPQDGRTAPDVGATPSMPGVAPEESVELAGLPGGSDAPPSEPSVGQSPSVAGPSDRAPAPSPELADAPEAANAPENTEAPSSETSPETEVAGLPAPSPAPEPGTVDLPASDPVPQPEVTEAPTPAIDTAPTVADAPVTEDSPRTGTDEGAAPALANQPGIADAPLPEASPEAAAAPDSEPGLTDVQPDEAPNGQGTIVPEIAEAPTMPETAEGAGTTPEPSETPAADTPAGSEVETTPEIADAPATPEGEVEVETEPGLAEAPTAAPLDDPVAAAPPKRPSVGFGSNRLPRVIRLIGEEGSEPEEDVVAETVEPEAEPVDPSAGALERFRANAEIGAGDAILSLVLLHEGGVPDAQMLAGLPSNLSFAIDASAPDAAEAAAAYRRAGREVVLIPALPERAKPQDVEQAMQANLRAVPEAVAVMDTTGGGFQSDREAVAQVVSAIEASGHGLITFPRGLNSAHQRAERAGVPRGLIFRDIDGKGEGADEIGRSLDRAAFRARQSRQPVILVGRTSDDTLSAVAAWSAEKGGDGVLLAPVSAALLAGS